MKKLFVLVSILVVFCLVFVLNGCGTNNASNKSDPVVPTYQGMTISKESTTAISNMAYSSPYMASPIRLMSSSMNSDEISATDEHFEHDETLENDIEDIVTIDVNTDDEVKYYVQPNETFIIQVHISNPYDYEIQSFTLNGKKYANYMFKDGSTMELLLLEVTAPSTSGYIEYSIDAIKYIDGTEIKDVDMSTGDKSIKAGIAYTEAPSAQILSQNISTTSFTIGINIFDRNSLIGSNELSIYLSDGQEVLDRKDLKVGENTITFDNLTMSTTYEYGIITAYDLIDGRDVHSEWLFTNRITTLGAFSFNNVKANKTSISFEINRTGEVGAIKSISLYDANTKELINSGDSSIRVFDNLLSSHTYNLYADFVYTINGEEVSDYTCVKSITTEAKVKPTLSFDNVSADKTSIGYTVSATDTDGVLNVTKVELLKNTDSVKDNGTTLSGTFTGLLSNNEYSVRVSYTYDLNDGQGAIADFISKSVTTEAKVKPTLSFDNVSITDTTISESFTKNDSDNIGTIDNVKLYKGNELQQTNSSKLINFTGLEYYTDYKVVIEFSYDLNDGNGLITDTCERTYKTSPHLVFNTCKIINTSAVSEGETIYMQVSLDNPSGALPASVVVNGQTYNCTGSTTTNKLYVEIVNNGQFEGGETELIIEKVNVSLDNRNYSIEPNTNNSDTVFINGPFEVLSVYFVDSAYNKIDWCKPSDEVFIMINMLNATGYTISDVVVGEDYFIGTSSNEIIVEKIDSEHYISPYNAKNGWNAVCLHSLTYKNAYLNKNITFSNICTSLFLVCSDETHYIDEPEDLLKMTDGYYYELLNDIDLSDYEWKGQDFYGVFDANNHKIKNMSFVGTIKDAQVNLGLFNYANGCIKNLVFTNATIIVDHVMESSLQGAFIGLVCSSTSERLNLDRCFSDSNCYIKYSQNVSVGVGAIGGLVGYAEANGFPYSGLLMTRCANMASIDTVISAGGLVGFTYGNAMIENCANYGNINSKCSGGIVGECCGSIINCLTTGILTGGGNRIIVGSADFNSGCTIHNCVAIINSNDKNTIDIISAQASGANERISFSIENIDVLTFFKDELGWDESIWDFSELDIENGKYPILKSNTK